IPVPQRVESRALIKPVSELSGIVDAVLLDTVLDGKTGGTGVPHNWEVSSEIVLHAGMPVILAGGLNPENVRAAVRTVRPYAVDAASGVETDGRKDEKKVTAFIKIARMHEI
ncbi:MAG: phosphoribosylanthranilate isomerase, partial [Candidatus Methanoperedens sp.]|nr:phosphoribosylanthranilate isomerase [Candidatus Methanoperedens sp.]